MQLRYLTILLILLSGCVEQENYPVFCPSDDCEDRLVIALGNAESSIDAAVYSITSEQLSQKLIEAHERGVKVRIVSDSLQASSKYSKIAELKEAGIDARISNKTMHNKFAIIDNKLVITGSYNWTKNANEENRENMVFVFDKELASEYSDEFFSLFTEAG